MNGNKALLDSNVIIDIAKGIITTNQLTQNYSFLCTSIINYIETLGYNFSDADEKEIIDQILTSLEIINLNKEIADIAVEYRKLKKIKLPDALILATAKYAEAHLITSDISDFQNIDNSVKIVEPIKNINPKIDS